MVDKTLVNLSMEIWKDVVGYEGLYQVSNYGNVYSLLTNKILKNSVNSRGYALIALSNNGKQRSFNTHRLVAIAFLPNSEGKPQVNHIDGDKLNNKIENLEWVSSKENVDHAYKNRLQIPPEHQKSTVADYCKKNYSKKVIQFDLTGNQIAECYSASEAARQTGVFQPYISKICRGEVKSKKYAFRYAEQN